MRRHSTSPRRSSRPSTVTRFFRSPLTRIGLPVAAAAAIVVSFAVWTPGATAKTGSATIWGAAAPSNVALQTTKSGVEVGTRFTVEQSGKATGVRFFKVQGVGGTHTGTLWTSKGTKIATVTFSGESASGWQSALFAHPVALTRGESYVVSYFQPRGRYASTANVTGASASPSLAVKRGAGVYRFTAKSAFPNRVWRNSLYWVDITFAPQGTLQRPDGGPSATPPPTPTPTPSVTPAPTTPPVVAPKPPAPPVVAPPVTKPSGGFPNASNTGVPAGTPLTGYAGPCTVTVPGTVIDAKTINCDLEIRAKNVVISRSLINGTVYADPDLGVGSFTISDSQVNIGNQAGTGIGDGNFTAIRVHVTGGNRSINCFLNCTVEYSYVHGQFTDSTGVYHESGIRMGSGSVIRGNTIGCTAPDVPPDAGCSAALTGYGDFATVQNNVIDGNLFLGGSGGYCAYGGSTSGKPYSNGVNNIRFTNNVFQRGDSGTCGWFGPITSFDTGARGNVWSGNRYDNGVPVQAAF